MVTPHNPPFSQKGEDAYGTILTGERERKVNTSVCLTVLLFPPSFHSVVEYHVRQKVLRPCFAGEVAFVFR